MGRLIVWGNCQAAALYEVLKRIPAVTSRWDVVHHELWASGATRARDLAQFDGCDVLLAQDLRDWRAHPRAASLDAGTRVVGFPFLYFAALWPFDGHQNGNDPGWRYGEGEAQFGFSDALLGRLRAEEPDPAVRLARYRALDVPDLPDIARYAAFEEARLLRDDARLGSSLGRFVVERYRRDRLFHAITHPALPLLARLATEVLARLEIDAGAIEVLDYLAYFQVPVHPEVVRMLALEWVDGSTSYNFQNREALSWEAYVTRYIRVYG
jgi:hypothetical protein